MYKKDLALNNQQWLICHKTKPNQVFFYCYVFFYFYSVVQYTVPTLERNHPRPMNMSSFLQAFDFVVTYERQDSTPSALILLNRTLLFIFVEFFGKVEFKSYEFPFLWRYSRTPSHVINWF